MTEAKQKLDAKIGAMVAASAPHRFIARRLFLYDFGCVFADNQDRGFHILNEICEKFKVPFSAVKVVGSAHTGYSYLKERNFVPGESDLDSRDHQRRAVSGVQSGNVLDDSPLLRSDKLSSYSRYQRCPELP